MMHHQNKQPYILYLVTVFVIGTLVWQSQAVKREAPSDPVVLVSVDIVRVYDSIEERAYEQSKVQAIADSMAKELELQRQAIDNYEQEFELYQPGSDKWEELIQEQQLAALEYEAQVEYMRRRTSRELSKGMRRLYEHIREASAELSKQNGWDYVFVNDAIIALPEGDNVDMDLQISSRSMLFAKTTFDVTDILIEYMNDSFDEMAVR